MGHLTTSADPDADTLIAIPGTGNRVLRSDPEKVAIEVKLRELPATTIIPIMGLRVEHIMEEASVSKLQRMVVICQQCVIQEDCQRNLKSCMRDADLIDMCPLWDAELIE